MANKLQYVSQLADQTAKAVTRNAHGCGNSCQGHTITQNAQSGVVTAAKILVESGTHDITFSGLNLTSAAVGIMPGGTMNLTLVGTNKIVGSGRGFYVPVGATLVITEQSTGSLDISLTNSTTAAGIGGAYYDPNGNDGDFSCGMVVINGGTITAAGRGDSAGIGGASYAPNFGNGGNITITGGHVTATGSDGAPGIGGGKDADSDGSLTLSSADVLAENTTLGAKGHGCHFRRRNHGRLRRESPVARHGYHFRRHDLCGLLLIPPACSAWILPTMRRYFSLYYLLRTARQIWQSSPEFLFVFSQQHLTKTENWKPFLA